MQLNESFNDALDEINDLLTRYCEEGYEQYQDVVSLVEKADAELRLRGLRLEFSDVEEMKDDLEAVDQDEVVSFLFPVYYNDGEISEYVLVLNYGFDAEEGRYIADAEMQYVWEQDDSTEELEYED